MAGDSDRARHVDGSACEHLSVIPVRPSDIADLAPVDDGEGRDRTPRRNSREENETEEEPGDDIHWRAPDEPLWRQYAQEMYDERMRQQNAEQNPQASDREEVPVEHAEPDEPDVGVGEDPDLGPEPRRPRKIP